MPTGLSFPYGYWKIMKSEYCILKKNMNKKKYIMEVRIVTEMSPKHEPCLCGCKTGFYPSLITANM